jgi:hypothetical protein
MYMLDNDEFFEDEEDKRSDLRIGVNTTTWSTSSYHDQPCQLLQPHKTFCPIKETCCFFKYVIHPHHCFSYSLLTNREGNDSFSKQPSLQVTSVVYIGYSEGFL